MYSGSVSGPLAWASSKISCPKYFSSLSALALLKSMRSCNVFGYRAAVFCSRYAAMSCLNSYCSAVFSSSYAGSIGMFAGSTITAPSLRSRLTVLSMITSVSGLMPVLPSRQTPIRAPFSEFAFRYLV